MIEKMIRSSYRKAVQNRLVDSNVERKNHTNIELEGEGETQDRDKEYMPQGGILFSITQTG